MNRVGASTAATASLGADSVGAGIADSVADSVGAGIAGAVSESDPGRLIMMTARIAIPMIAAIRKRGDVPCLGAALGLAGALGLAAAGALFAGVGIVVMFARDGLFTPPTGTGGTVILLAEVDFLTEDFFAVFFTTFFAVFLTTFLAAAFFFAGAFFATFFAAAFFTTFFTAAFLRAGAFLATFFAEAFFLTATMELPLAIGDCV